MKTLKSLLIKESNNNLQLSLELYKDGGKYCAFLAGDGDSGIKVAEKTKEDCVKKLSEYILDYFVDIN